MKTPESLETLADYGIIQQVVRPLMSGKEAQVFIVVSDGQECVAKVYKEATQRTFKHRAEYTEGRKTRNTRDQRAINKRTRHGKKQDEAAWRNAEVDTLYRLRDGGVRVPEPLNFVDGVLVMELVQDAAGEPAPRLGDLDFTPEEAYAVYTQLIREVVRMLCVGTIHGDLSEFNVLMAAEGPVVIDFPQSIDPSKNSSARKLLLRDVENLHRFLRRHAPERRIRPLGQEMWALYEKNRLRPDTELVGDYQAPSGSTDVSEVLALIDEAKEERRPRSRSYDQEEDDMGQSLPRSASSSDADADARPPLRRVVDFTQAGSGGSAARRSDRSGKRTNKGARKPGQDARAPSRSRKPNPAKSPPRGPASQRDERSGAPATSLADGDAAPSREGSTARPNTSPSSAGPKRKRRRRRRSPNRPEQAASSSPEKTPPRGPAATDSGKGGSRDGDAPKSARPRRRRSNRRPKKPRPAGPAE